MGLKALHSGIEKIASVQRVGTVRRRPMANINPLVRTHAATGDNYVC